MAIVALLEAFKGILKILQEFDIIHLRAKVDSIYIWALIIFSHFPLCFSYWLQNNPRITTYGF